MKNYKEEITRIARENIHKADNAGGGMYNFDLYIEKSIQGKKYPRNIILQTYPYLESDYYGLVYLLCYYPLDKDEMNWEHDDYDFFDLTDEEKGYIFNEFKKQIQNKKMETKLSNFVKKNITFDEKVRLIADWEEDRGSDGEYVYDLDNDEDAWCWKELYDLKTLYKCRAEGRYWLGGWQFGCNGLNEKGNCSTAWCITEKKLESYFTDGNLLGEIADRFEEWLKANKDVTEAEAIRDFSLIYENLIDFKAYKKALTPNKYGVTCTMVYNGYHEVEAESEEEALEKVRNMLNIKDRNDFENGGYVGDVYFGFGEVTADYAEKL